MQNDANTLEDHFEAANKAKAPLIFVQGKATG